MTGSINVITTRTDGWQKTCQAWAQAGEPFEVQGLGAAHLSFCKEFCDAFNYKCHYDSQDSAAVFVPTSD